MPNIAILAASIAVPDQDEVMLPNRALVTRVERSTRTIPGASNVLDFVRRKSVRQRLAEAAKAGIPPVTAISHDLVKLLGQQKAKNPQLARFTGMAVSLVLSEEGFELSQKGVRVRADPLFSSASTYVRVEPSAAGDAESVLINIADSLSAQHQRLLFNYLAAKLKD